MDTIAVMSRFFALLTVLANLTALGALVLLVARRSTAQFRGDLAETLRAYALPLAWLVALTATLGSLYYSEVANFVPCKLCWYQRIAMYPLSIILGIAALKKDFNVRRYVLPIVGIGGAISVYHYVLQRFPELSSASCDPSAPCTVTWVWQFHYISIPLMALSGFALIAALLLMAPGVHQEISTSEPIEEEEGSHEFSLSSSE